MNVFGIPLGNGKYQKLIAAIWKTTFYGFISFLVYLIAVNFNLFWLFGKMPNIEDLDNPKSEIASELISSDGKVLGKYFFQNRSPVEFDELPASLIDALIATEDVRFTRHPGIDARSTLRVITGVLTLNRKGGGSTITQQLAKNLFRLRQDSKYLGPVYSIPGLRSLVIKTKEWITATKLERIYTKQEIMKLYLDTIEFSSGAYGIKSAAKTYFNKPVSDLTVNESALLVGMIQNPSRFNPNLRPKNATTRRNTVLSQMAKYGKIESEKLEDYQKEPIALSYNPASHNTGLAPYFREFLKDWIKAEIEKLGYDEEDLYTKGFKIYTTIDSRMQRYAEEAVAEHMKAQQKQFLEHWKGQNPWVQRASENSSRYVEIPNFIENMASRTGYYQALKREFGGDKAKIMKGMNVKMPMRVFTWQGERDTLMSHMDSIRHYKRFLNIGMMAMDPRDGNIKAWVGGINYKYFKYDHVAQSKRQPGSTFKPFVYVTAIENGFSTCDRVNDSPVTFGPEDGVPGSWTPKNSDGKYSYQDLTLRQALGQSVNTVSAKLIKRFTPAEVVKKAHELGIKSDLNPVPALCLGVSEVSLFEMLAGYASFVNSGKYTDPIFVLRIEDKYGEVLREYVPNQKEVLSAETAYKMVHLMRGATQSGGTSVGLARYGILDGNEVAGKTGTTSNFSDGWFMGLTQELIGGVWAGGDDRAIHYRTIAQGQGARIAMPAWGMFMQKVYADPDIPYKKTKFKVPATVRISGDCVISAGEVFGPINDSTGTYRPPTVKPANKDELL